ncbi:MAG: hydrogenase maturation nickel metallochaperone HypA [Thermoflexales bacterium]|nr:hydrogenase maturation nickel metallochaperone HypA [Thermoflexales bacterium]MDW8350737.1 hydrogenase maturation nickel metallochaperone HypA [Anaerolineae bacterium]
MHELSIAVSLVESAEQAARRAGARRVTQVFLRLGALSGVAKEALLFSYDIATAGTLLEGSLLVIDDVPVVLRCDACRRDVTLPGIQDFRCPLCGRPTAQIVAGRELEITGIEVEVADEASPQPTGCV